MLCTYVILQPLRIHGGGMLVLCAPHSYPLLIGRTVVANYTKKCQQGILADPVLPPLAPAIRSTPCVPARGSARQEEDVLPLHSAKP